MNHTLIIISFLLFTQTINAQYIWQDTIVGFGIKPEVTTFQDKIHIAYLSETNPGFVAYAEIEENEIKNENVTTGYFYGPLDIKVDQNGIPIVVYHDHDTEDLGLARRLDESWAIERIPNDGHDGWDGSIYIDENNQPHIISIDPGRGVEYARIVDDEWFVETVDGESTNYKFATAITGHDDEIYLAYHINSTNSL